MEGGRPTERLRSGTLFAIFFRAGLAFSGGLSILAVLEDELVGKRRVVSREELLTIYGLARIVPSGTMTALAVAYGHRFGGLLGTIIALLALALPAFLLTVGLTVAYGALQGGPVMAALPVTILPAALAFIVAAALRLGRDVARPSPELVLASGAFAGSAILGLNPALLLLLGGGLGARVVRGAGGGGR